VKITYSVLIFPGLDLETKSLSKLKDHQKMFVFGHGLKAERYLELLSI
jgi:hypothetical protein